MERPLTHEPKASFTPPSEYYPIHHFHRLVHEALNGSTAADRG